MVYNSGKVYVQLLKTGVGFPRVGDFSTWAESYSWVIHRVFPQLSTGFPHKNGKC